MKSILCFGCSWCKLKQQWHTNIEIIHSDFTKASETWTKPINILHMDGFPKYDSVKNDFINWSKYLEDDGIVLFHNTHVHHYEIKDFFNFLSR
jgi:hypothetical protein